MGKVGSAMIDMSAQFAARVGVVGDGSSAGASDLNDHSIVEAVYLVAARRSVTGARSSAGEPHDHRRGLRARPIEM